MSYEINSVNLLNRCFGQEWVEAVICINEQAFKQLGERLHLPFELGMGLLVETACTHAQIPCESMTQVC